MGDIANGLINGDFDFITGEYLGNGGGFPRSIHDDPAHYRETKARNKAYWNSLSNEEKEVREVYRKIRGRQMGNVRMREIALFISKELNIIQVPKAKFQYKLIKENLDKFKEFLKQL